MSIIDTTQYVKYLNEVAKSGFALKFVPEEYQTEEICLVAVKQNGHAVKHVINQTENICLAAVNDNGMALRYVREQTPKICAEAINSNPNSINAVIDLFSVAPLIDDKLIEENIEKLNFVYFLTLKDIKAKRLMQASALESINQDENILRTAKVVL